MAKRVMARIPDEVAEKIVSWSSRLGITQSQLMGMAIQAGLDNIIRAISPAESITPELLAKIAKAIELEGGNKDEFTANGNKSPKQD